MSFLSCMLLEVIYYGLGFLWILILNDFAKKCYRYKCSEHFLVLFMVILDIRITDDLYSCYNTEAFQFNTEQILSTGESF